MFLFKFAVTFFDYLVQFTFINNISHNYIFFQRKMRSNELAKLIGITDQNLSILKSGKAKAIRFSTLQAICKHLNCQPGDILAYEAIISELA